MKIIQVFFGSHRPRCFEATRLLVLLIVAVISCPQNSVCQPATVHKLTLTQVEELVSHHVPDSTMRTEIQRRGLAFSPNPEIVDQLRAKGAGPLTLEAIETLFPKAPQGSKSNRAASVNKAQLDHYRGTQVTLGSGLSHPRGVAVDGSGNVFVADGSAEVRGDVVNAVREILALDGYTTIKTLGSGFNSPVGLALDGSGNIFVADAGGPSGSAVKVIMAAGGYTAVKTLNSGFGALYGLALDGRGNVFIAETGGGSVKRILAAGGYRITNPLKIQGTKGNPWGVAVDAIGNVFVAYQGWVGEVKEIPFGCDSAACVKTLGGGFGHPTGVAVDGRGNVFVADSDISVLKEIPSGCASASCVRELGSGFSHPEGVAVDLSGNVYVADTGNDRVVMLQNAGVKSTLIPVTNLIDIGPSLTDTMQFIQNKMNEQGQVGYAMTTSRLKGVIYRHVYVMSGVVANPALCTLDTTETTTDTIEVAAGFTFSEKGIPVTSEDLHRRRDDIGTGTLKDVEKVIVENVQDFEDRRLAETGHAEITNTITPAIFYVQLLSSKPVFSFHNSYARGNQASQVQDITGKTNSFIFRDEEMANRVAKAMRHAIELCGGNRDSF